MEWFFLMRFTSHLAILSLTAICCAGCADHTEERFPIAGTVVIDGRPLTNGTIRFVPSHGRPASSEIDADGCFELVEESVNQVSRKGLPRGTYRVQVAASKIVDDQTIEWNAPRKYADFRTSGLTVDVDRPTEGLLITLSWKGSEPVAENGSDAATEPRSELEPAGESRSATTDETDVPSTSDRSDP